MIECEWVQYVLITLFFLLVISLYFNLKLSKTIKLHNQNDNVLIRSAYFNPVTDLPNRANMELVIDEQIDRALRHNQTFLVSSIKILNYHDIKIRSEDLVDKFMREASDKLLSSIRDEDFVGHISDDGFIVLFNEYLDEENYEVIINRIKMTFSEAPHIDTKYNIEYDIGIGHISYPMDGTDAKLLIDRATHNALK